MNINSIAKKIVGELRNDVLFIYLKPDLNNPIAVYDKIHDDDWKVLEIQEVLYDLYIQLAGGQFRTKDETDLISLYPLIKDGENYLTDISNFSAIQLI